MTGFQWFTLIQTVVMTLAAAGVALLYRGFQTGKWVQNQESRSKEIDQITTRLDRAGQKISDLATDVQGLPERMHRDFIPRETFLIEITGLKERQKDLWTAIHGRSGRVE